MNFFILNPKQPIKADKPTVILEVLKSDIRSYVNSVDPLLCTMNITIDGNMFEKMITNYMLEVNKV